MPVECMSCRVLFSRAFCLKIFPFSPLFPPKLYMAKWMPLQSNSSGPVVADSFACGSGFLQFIVKVDCCFCKCAFCIIVSPSPTPATYLFHFLPQQIFPVPQRTNTQTHTQTNSLTHAYTHVNTHTHAGKYSVLDFRFFVGRKHFGVQEVCLCVCCNVWQSVAVWLTWGGSLCVVQCVGVCCVCRSVLQCVVVCGCSTR